MSSDRELAIDAVSGKIPPTFGRDWALLLDADGTLLDYHDDPAAVMAAADLVVVLEELFVLTGGAVALVSGRGIADLDRIFAPMRLPCAGQHGLEMRLPDGRLLRTSAASPTVDAVCAELLRLIGSTKGVLVENKGLSLTLHFRSAPGERDRLMALAQSAVHSTGDTLRLVEANQAIEIRSDASDKGRAITILTAFEPFRGRQPVFVGDDRSDEDGFAVVNDMGGVSVKVGPGNTCARWRLPNPAAVRTWLHDATRRLRAHSGV